MQKREIDLLTEELKGALDILTALGDETRQHLILMMMANGDCSGMRVVDIAEKANLSRPAISHHLNILKGEGIVKMRREGTKKYYYFNTDTESLDHLIAMLQHVRDIMSEPPAADPGTVQPHQSTKRQ